MASTNRDSHIISEPPLEGTIWLQSAPGWQLTIISWEITKARLNPTAPKFRAHSNYVTSNDNCCFEDTEFWDCYRHQQRDTVDNEYCCQPWEQAMAYCDSLIIHKPLSFHQLLQTQLLWTITAGSGYSSYIITFWFIFGCNRHYFWGRWYFSRWSYTRYGCLPFSEMLTVSKIPNLIQLLVIYAYCAFSNVKF